MLFLYFRSSIFKEYKMGSVGETIQILRKAKNIKQIDFAVSIGISRTHLSDVERGKKGLSMKAAEKISRALGVGVSELFNYDLYQKFPRQMMRAEKSVKNIETFYEAVKTHDISHSFDILSKFGLTLYQLSDDYEMYFTRMKDYLLREVAKGVNPDDVLKQNPEILQIISEYSSLVKNFKIDLSNGRDYENYRLLRNKMSAILGKINK